MKWVIGIVVALIVVCGGLCAAGGGYYYWMAQSGGGIEVPTFALDPDEAQQLLEPAPVGDGKVGVESCDAYIEKMTACLGTMDAATKSAMESAFKQTTDAWRAAAATPEGKAGLEIGCKAALDAIPSTCSGGVSATPVATDAVPPAATETPATTTTPASASTPATTPAATSPAATTTPAATSPATSTAAKPAPSTATKPAPAAASTTAKPAPTTTAATTPAATTTSPSSKQGTSISRPAPEDDGPPPASASGDSKVAVGFVLPSGGKWDDLVVGVDGSSLGKRPLRTRATPGTHTFTFKTDGLDLSCSIDIGSSGRTIILDQKKKACPAKSG